MYLTEEDIATKALGHKGLKITIQFFLRSTDVIQTITESTLLLGLAGETR